MGFSQSKVQKKFNLNARKELLETPVNNLIQQREIVTLHESDTLQYALETLASNGISSTPVQVQDDWILLDLLDILEHLDKDSLNMTLQEVLQDENQVKRRLKVQMSETVDQVVKKMMNHSAHRVMIMEGDRLIHVLTQSALIEFMLKNLDILHPKPDLSLASLSLYGTPPPLTCCNSNDGTLQAYQQMQKLGYTSLPVVNDLGVMCGFLSARDVKFLIGKGRDDMYLPVQDYLGKHRPKSRQGSLDDSLRELLTRFVKERAHHMFFVDDVGAPINVITLTDVLKVIFTGDYSSPLFRDVL